MQYLIWGAGFRGRRLLDFLGRTCVEAFLDSATEKQGTTLEGIPILAPAEGIAAYPEAYILISSIYDGEIKRILEQRGISRHTSMNDLPQEWQQGIPIDADDLRIPVASGATLALYGLNPWSAWLYRMLRERGWDVFLVPDRGEEQKAEFFLRTESLGIRTTPMGADVVLVTNCSFEQAALRFPAWRIEDFWNLTHRLPGYRHPELAAFYRLHAGQRAFLVATGPSLRFEDLERLHRAGEITFSVNTVYRAFARTDWRPDYYVMSDSNGIREYANEIKKLSLPHLFLTDAARAFWADSRIDRSRFHAFHAVSSRMGTKNLVPFSSDITQCVYACGSVMYDVLQFTVYMGFRELYLLGADCSYDGMPWAWQNHFIPDYFHADDAQPKMMFPLEETFAAYQSARRYAERHGTKIYNATRGGKLEVFPRVAFDSLF